MNLKSCMAVLCAAAVAATTTPEKTLNAPKLKDLWDKLGTVSGFTSGVIVAVIGFYATNIYDREQKARSAKVTELQAVEKLIPHLDHRFHEVCHKRGIHLGFQAPYMWPGAF